MSLTNQGSINLYIPQRATYMDDTHGTPCTITCSNTNGINQSFCVSSAYSIAMWVKTSDTSDDGFFTRGASTTYPVFYTFTNKARIKINSTEGINSVTNISDNQWHHIVATFDKSLTSNHLKLYFDGKLENSLTCTKYTTDSKNKNVILFGYAVGTGLYHGVCNNFQFFSGNALSANDVKKIYNGIPVTTKRVCEFKFDDYAKTNFNSKVIRDTTKTISGNFYTTPIWTNREIKCWCNRWDEGNYDVVLETMMDACDRNYLFENVHPGQLSTTTTNMGWVINNDISYRSGNTLILEPLGGRGVSGLRSSTKIVVKNISDTFLNRDTFGVKIEGLKIKKWSDYI